MIVLWVIVGLLVVAGLAFLVARHLRRHAEPEADEVAPEADEAVPRDIADSVLPGLTGDLRRNWRGRVPTRR